MVWWGGYLGCFGASIGAGVGGLGRLCRAPTAGVVEGNRECMRKPDALVELADGKQSGIAGELAGRWLDHERRAEKIQALWLVWS